MLAGIGESKRNSWVNGLERTTPFLKLWVNIEIKAGGPRLLIEISYCNLTRSPVRGESARKTIWLTRPKHEALRTSMDWLNGKRYYRSCYSWRRPKSIGQEGMAERWKLYKQVSPPELWCVSPMALLTNISLRVVPYWHQRNGIGETSTGYARSYDVQADHCECVYHRGWVHWRSQQMEEGRATLRATLWICRTPVLLNPNNDRYYRWQCSVL